MKKSVLYLISLLSVFVSAYNAFAGAYDAEIGLLNENRFALLKKAEQVAKNNKEFLIVWHSIAHQLKMVKVERFNVSKTGNSEVDLYRNLINESVHLSHSFSEFNLVNERIEYLKGQSQQLCIDADWLCPEHHRNVKLIDENKSKFGRTLEQRKNNLDLALKKWSQRQIDIFLTDQARIRRDLVQGVKLDQLVSRLSSIFFGLNNKVRMAILERNREKAEDTLSAIVWFRSIVPVFFSDKVMTEYSRTILEGAIKSSEETEKTLRKQVNELKYKTASLRMLNRAIASALFESLYGGGDIMERFREKGHITEDDITDQDFKEFDKDQRQMGHMFATTGGFQIVVGDRDSIKDFEKRFSPSSEHSQKVANAFDSKSIHSGNGGSGNGGSANGGSANGGSGNGGSANGGSANGGSGNGGSGNGGSGKGLVRVSEGKVAEKVAVESAREIEQKVTDYVRDRFNDRESGVLSSTPESVGNLLKRSELAVRQNLVAEFQKLKSANAELKAAQDSYLKVVDLSLRAARSVHHQISNEMNGSVANLMKSEPGYASIDSLPNVDGPAQFDMVSRELRTVLNLHSSASLESFDDFVRSAEFSFGGHHSLESTIVQDVISGRNTIEIQPGRNYQEKKINYQLSRFESQLSAQRASGGMSVKESFDFVGSLSQFAQQNRIKASDLSGKNRHQPGSFNFTVTERFKKIAAEVASIGFGFTPAGVVLDVYSLISSRDFFTGVKLTQDEMIFTAVGLVVGQGALLRNVFKELKAVKAISKEAEIALKHGDEIAKTIEILEEFNPLVKGPLSEIKVGLSGKLTVTDTFRSGTYRKMITNDSKTKLYRVYGGEPNPLGAYWTRSEPKGPWQSLVDSALDQSINKTTNWVEIELPKGTVFYEGIAAPMPVKGGKVLGGGNQIYFTDKVQENWITREGEF